MGLDERLAAGKEHETQPNYCSEMTPKDKANELVDKFFAITMNCNLIDGGSGRAKQCALIAVEEILKNFDGLHKPEYCSFDAIGERKFTFAGEYDDHMTGYDMVEYWNEVESEIEKL